MYCSSETVQFIAGMCSDMHFFYFQQKNRIWTKKKKKKNDIGATIRMSRDIQCLLYAGFFCCNYNLCIIVYLLHGPTLCYLGNSCKVSLQIFDQHKVSHEYHHTGFCHCMHFIVGTHEWQLKVYFFRSTTSSFYEAYLGHELKKKDKLYS